MGGKPWTGAELQKLRACDYRNQAVKDLQRIFPGRSVHSIKKQAGRIGVATKSYKSIDWDMVAEKNKAEIGFQ